MATEKKITKRDVAALMKRLGGSVEDDGCGGFDAIAPDGYEFVETESSVQPFPVTEYDDKGERQEMISGNYEMLSRGIRKRT